MIKEGEPDKVVLIDRFLRFADGRKCHRLCIGMETVDSILGLVRWAAAPTVLLRLELQVDADRVARTSEGFGIASRQHVKPRIAFTAGKKAEKLSERSHNGSEVLLSEVRPGVVVHSLVHRPAPHC